MTDILKIKQLRLYAPNIAAWLVVFLMVGTLWTHVDTLVEQDRVRTMDNALQDMSNLTRVAQEHAARTFRSADQALRFVKARYEEQGAALDLPAMVRQGVIDADIFNQVGIIDTKGIYALSNLPIATRMDLSDREHFKVHLALDSEELFISKALLGRASKKWSIQMTRRINGRDGAFGGVAVVSIDPYYFTRFFVDLNLGLHGAATLFGLDGEVRARRAGGKEEFAITLRSDEVLAAIGKGNGSGTFTRVSSIDGVERIYFYRHIQPYRIGIMAGLATEEVLLDHRQVRAGLFFQASLATLLILVLGCAFSWHQRRMWQEMNARMLVKQELAALNVQLTLQVQHADAANLAKSAFLANMSHELRTPMNAVIGIAYLLQKIHLPGDANELVRKIGVAGHALLAIINDVLDLSKIEAGRIEIEQLPFNLNDVLDDLSSIMSFNAQQKKIALRIAAAPGIDCLRGDAMHLKQVLLNLVGNGIKFTERGHVHLDIGVLAQSTRHVTLRFCVSDSGIGIAPDRQEAIFESFLQEDSSTTRRFGGSGLGLTISRHLVALMEGEMGVSSVVGSGSEFWFTLRFERQAESMPMPVYPGRPSLRNQRLLGARMMVVDDSDINRDMALRIFEGEGAQVTLADDGQHALQWLQQHPDQIDVVLMDLQMPVMDGYQATRLIRATPALANLPVIALTAGAFREQEQAARDVGMVGFLSKPFDVDVAIELILCVRLGHGPASVPASGSASDSAPDPAPDTAPDTASPSNVIDIGRGVQLCSDRHAYNTYLRRFVDSYGDAVGALHASLADDDRAAAAALAHKLAGVAGNLALPDTHKLAGVLELVLATANDPTPALEDLRIALAQAVAAIEQFALPAAVPRPEPLASMQPPAPLERLLCDLMAALDGDDPEPAEPLLAALAHHLSKEQLQSIVRCVCEFDFRGAEAGVTRLAKELDFTLEK